MSLQPSIKNTQLGEQTPAARTVYGIYFRGTLVKKIAFQIKIFGGHRLPITRSQ